MTQLALFFMTPVLLSAGIVQSLPLGDVFATLADLPARGEGAVAGRSDRGCVCRAQTLVIELYHVSDGPIPQVGLDVLGEPVVVGVVADPLAVAQNHRIHGADGAGFIG